MGIWKSLQMVAVMLAVALAAHGVEAGSDAKPKKGDEATTPPPPPAKVEEIHLKGVWTRAARKGENAYIFLTVKNESESPIRLKGGYVDVAKRVRIVKFKVRGPFLQAMMVGPVPVEGHETYVFEPGIAALELQELNRDLHMGDVLPITIAFARAGEIDIEAEVDSRSAVRYPDPPEKLEEKKKAH